MLVQTEIERVKFIVRSYVRTRLFKVHLTSLSLLSIVSLLILNLVIGKIEKYARFVTSNADVQRRLTAAERDHASRYAAIFFPFCPLLINTPLDTRK